MPRAGKFSRFLFLFSSLTFFVFQALPLFADFKLVDAIQEFGEKRFLKTSPARIKTGPFRIHPSLRKKAAYDNNILLESQDKREDVVFNIQPGAIVELPFSTHQIAVGYEADFEIFSKSRDFRQNDQNQNFFALADIHFPSWYINLLERLSETSGRSGTTFTDRIPRIDQSIHPKLGYRWRRAVFEAGFRHSVRDFRRQIDDALDFQLVEWTGVFFYDLFARLKLLAEYKWAQIDYDDDFRRNGTFQQARVGLEGEILPNLFLKVRAGPHLRNYYTSSKPDFNSWVGDFRLDYEFRKGFKLNAKFSREPVEATFLDVNFFKEHLYQFGAEYKFRPQWTGFSEIRYYRHSYAERASLGGRTGFRRDHHLGWKAGVRYLLLEWWELELAYEYLRRDSNFSTFDYTDHLFSLTSALAY